MKVFRTHAVLAAALAVSTLGAFGRAEEIPFNFRDGFMWIEVTTPHIHRPMRFLVDSGAQMSVISTSVARQLALRPGRHAILNGVGGHATGFLAEVTGLRTGTVRLPGHYVITSLDKLSSACTNGTVEGIIGKDFFEGRAVEIDFREERMRVLPSSRVASAWEVLPLKVRRSGILVPVQVNSSRAQWVRLDTGCASALHLLREGFDTKVLPTRAAIGLSSFCVSMDTVDLTVGATPLPGTPTEVHTEEIYPGEMGLLGNGVLSQFETVTIDCKRKQLLLGSKLPPSTPVAARADR